MRVAPAVTISTEFLFRSWVASTSAPPIIAHLSTYHNCLDAYKIPEATVCTKHSKKMLFLWPYI